MNLPHFQWSLRAMFRVTAACAVILVWWRVRSAVDPNWEGGFNPSLTGILAAICLVGWIVWASIRSQPLRYQTEILAAVLLLSGVNTVWGITARFLVMNSHNMQRLREHILSAADNSAAYGYGFFASCVLAIGITFPSARHAMTQPWFLVLTVAVTLNICVLVSFCHWFGNLMVRKW